jgi:phosphoribosylaminoimidazole-succinocarboxamide synthase
MNLEQLKSWGIEPLRSGKVRDLYTYQDELWIVASDRISAFDVILPNLIPGKGFLLTQIARQWFDRTGHLVPNHVISYDLPDGIDIPEWTGRIVRSKKTKVIPVECVARGYLAGSGWKEYQELGTCGGHPLPKGLQESSELPQVLFTPSTKAEEGHDENLTEAQAREQIGDVLYDTLKNLTLTIYRTAKEFARKRGIIIADTKFEFGWLGDQIILIDEILTPDSSRFWPADQYQPGKSQPSFDKQILRNYLETLDWNKTAPGPVLPGEIIQKIQAKYQEAFDLLKS